jgi:hypothetical protein
MKFRKVEKHAHNVGKAQAATWVEWTRRWASKVGTDLRTGPLNPEHTNHNQVLAYAKAGLVR